MVERGSFLFGLLLATFLLKLTASTRGNLGHARAQEPAPPPAFQPGMTTAPVGILNFVGGDLFWLVDRNQACQRAIAAHLFRETPR